MMANWRELSRKKNWKGLLYPLNKNLGRTIIHYGKVVQAIYDTIDDDINSESYRRPKYKVEEFFSEVSLGMYNMDNYLFASAKDVDFYNKDQDAWIGYVAVATDEGKEALGRRDIMICWRGTLTPAEWIKDILCTQKSASVILGQHPQKPCVHEGFLSIYMSARDHVLKAVRKLVGQYKHEEISITVSGHSLGSALATLNVAGIVANGYNKPAKSDATCMVTAFVFASPMVGNVGFLTVFNKLSNLRLLYIKDVSDLVPELPQSNNYEKLGYELNINSNLILPINCHILKNILKEVEAAKRR